MYGTVARFRLKPGMEAQLTQEMKAYETLGVPGHVNTTVYRMDEDSNEYYMSVVFADKESYTKNADSPEQNERYQKFASFVEGQPEWHDGEIVFQQK